MLSRASCCHTASAYSQSAHHHSMHPGLSQQNPSPIENVRASAHVLFSSTVTRHPPSSQVNQRFQRSSPCRPQTQLMFLPPLKPVSCRWAGTTVATTNFGFRVASVRDAALHLLIMCARPTVNGTDALRKAVKRSCTNARQVFLRCTAVQRVSGIIP